MKHLEQIFGVKSWGKKIAGLLALLALVIFVVGFSSPRYFSATAASWLDQIFNSSSRPAKRSRYRTRVRTQYPVRQTSKRRRRSFGIGKINNVRQKSSRKSRRKYIVPKKRSRRYLRRRGTYRTMCVRTCDGYFFPVSFAARKRNLRKDAKACRSSCGAPARLYYYPNPGGKIKDMISYKGKTKYKRMRNAFLFKKKFVADCRCKPEPWTQAAKLQHKQYAMIKKNKPVRKLALQKRKIRKKRGYKRRYSRLSKKRRNPYIRTVGAKKHKRYKVRKRRIRKKRRTSSWTF